jgi:hypothetical protein
MISGHDQGSAEIVGGLLDLAVQILPRGYLGAGEFAFTLAADAGQGTTRQVRPRGRSTRYAAIAALGLSLLPEPARRGVLGGDDVDDVLGLAMKRLDEITGRGDVALLCWAAAEAGHSELPHALDRLRALDEPVFDQHGPADDALDVTSAAWIVSALVAARGLADVEQHLALARRRLLAARSEVFPHLVSGRRPWYRSHVGSFADQVYSVQALARLHASSRDLRALAAAEVVAAAICQAQGPAGQWWWHYDARTGGVVEGYPVYSVHQHAMAPMALLDLADAGGQGRIEAVCRGLAWLSQHPETPEPMIERDPPMIWRKVARADRAKIVRGISAGASRVVPGIRVPGLGAMFRPRVIDYECRPYELGWLLYAWLAGPLRQGA